MLPVDAVTLICCLRISVPLLRAAKVDQGLLETMLNYLVSLNAAAGCPVTLPEGCKVEFLPPEVFEAERRVLAQLQVG